MSQGIWFRFCPVCHKVQGLCMGFVDNAEDGRSFWGEKILSTRTATPEELQELRQAAKELTGSSKNVCSDGYATSVQADIRDDEVVTP